MRRGLLRGLAWELLPSRPPGWKPLPRHHHKQPTRERGASDRGAEGCRDHDDCATGGEDGRQVGRRGGLEECVGKWNERPVDQP